MPFIIFKGEIIVNRNGKNSEQSSDSQDIQIARLAFIGASIVTLGDAISAVAAGLALESLEKSKNQDSQKNDSPPHQSKDMQKQLDYLINELRQIKRMMK